MIQKKFIVILILFILQFISPMMVSADDQDDQALLDLEEPVTPQITAALEEMKNLKVRETSLGILPKGYQVVPNSIKISPDCKNVTYAAFSDKTHNIVQVNRDTSPVYYAIKGGMPIWSPDSKRYAYIGYKNKAVAVVVVDNKTIDNLDDADNFLFSPLGLRYAFRAQKNKRQFVVLDGIPGTLYDGIPIKDNFTFSPDSKRFIYVALKNNSCVAVVDGHEEPLAFNFILSVRFSPDSTQYAYKARTEKNSIGKEKWCVVKNGQAGPIYDKIFDLVFSYDSKRFAYSAIKDKKMVMVLDGQELDAHDTQGLPVFSLDSKTIATSYSDDKRWFVLVNNEKSDAFDLIYKFNFSPDSKKSAFFAQKGDEWFCVIGGESGPGFEKAIEAFKFSPNSNRYSYAGVDEDGSKIITDGIPGQDYLSVGESYFSPDSRHLVYRAMRPGEGQWITVLDGKESKQKYNGIGQYIFSSNSKHLAFPAITTFTDSMMVVDGVEQCKDKKFKILGEPIFSPESNFIVYHARAAEEKWHLIINGQVLPGIYGGFFKGTPILFDSNSHFHTLGIKPGGKEFVLIDVEVPLSFKLTTGIEQL